MWKFRVNQVVRVAEIDAPCRIISRYATDNGVRVIKSYTVVSTTGDGRKFACDEDKMSEIQEVKFECAFCGYTQHAPPDTKWKCHYCDGEFEGDRPKITGAELRLIDMWRRLSKSRLNAAAGLLAQMRDALEPSKDHKHLVKEANEFLKGETFDNRRA